MTKMTAEAAPAAEDFADGLQWHGVCRTDELEPAWGEAALVGKRQIAVIRLSDAEIYAVDQRDPMTGAFVMSRGIVGTSGNKATLASPLHKEVYSLATGKCLGNPDLQLQTFPVKVLNDVVLIGLPDQTAQSEVAA